jgi:hypothetical protein
MVMVRAVKNESTVTLKSDVYFGFEKLNEINTIPQRVKIGAPVLLPNGIES